MKHSTTLDSHPTGIDIFGDTTICSSYSGSIQVLDSNSLKLHFILPSKQILSQAKFHTNGDSVWACYKEGNIKLWDLRTCQPGLDLVLPFPAASFDFCNNMLVVGADLVQEDASVFFYDLRSLSAPVHVFDEVHSDDVTQIRIHPIYSHVMISGSTDGLVNLYDLSKTTEGQDECLYQVIKTDSVNKLDFFGPEMEYISCTSHMETFSIFRFEQGELVKAYGDCRNSDVDYLVDTYYNSSSEQLILVGGTRSGNVRLLNVQLDCLNPVSSLTCGHTDIITSCRYDGMTRKLFTGGEEGNLTYWSLD